MQSSSSSGSLQPASTPSSAKYPSLGSKGLKGQSDGGEISLLAVQKLQLEVEHLSKVCLLPVAYLFMIFYSFLYIYIFLFFLLFLYWFYLF
jgi:hypothetical protein